MKINKLYIGLLLASVAVLLIIGFYQTKPKQSSLPQIAESLWSNLENKPRGKEAEKVSHPMAIANLRSQEYPGGDFVIENVLANGTNYRQMVVSYLSEGLKIYGLLTIPLAPRPENGYPAVLFVHGYIPPSQYSTIGNYPTYQAALARAPLVTFKPDLRGHGQSEGEPVSAHFSEKYVVDALYALSYLKNHPEIDSQRIGYWGHSNGGETGLRVAVISTDIKAASFWAGVVGSFEDMLETYNDKIPFLRNALDNELVIENGLPSTNPNFWKQIDPYAYLADIHIPIELQHGSNDDSVPIELSLRLKEELEKLNKTVIYHEYVGDDHNIGNNSSRAWQRTIEFFQEHL